MGNFNELYVVDDIVKYGGNTYVVSTKHTSQSTSSAFYTDLSAGKYSNYIQKDYISKAIGQVLHYKLNDLVKYGAFQYRTTTQHTSTSTFDNTKFEVFNEVYNLKTLIAEAQLIKMVM